MEHSNEPATRNLISLVGLFRILVLFLLMNVTTDALGVTRFNLGENNLEWRVVNDDVMGGRSRGGFEIDGGILRFSGTTNTVGGGFSSIRSVPQRLSISNASSGMALRSKGDGRTYTFRVETSDGVSYWAEFRSTLTWRVIKVPFSTFRPRWRGRYLEGPALTPEDITSLGLMVYDKRDGDFYLEVDWIGTWR